MAIMVITDKFVRQEDGKWQAEITGFSGLLQVEHASSEYDCLNVLGMMSGQTPTHQKSVFGRRATARLDFPSTMTLILSCERKPVSVAYATFDGGSGSGGSGGSSTVDYSVDIANLKAQMAEQIALNELQQQQIEKNADDNDAQQHQIDANTELNERQEQGIGEDAASDLINSVFGKKTPTE